MQNSQTKWRIIFGVVSALCIISLVFMVITFVQKDNPSGSFVSPAFDQAAQEGTPQVRSELGYGTLSIKDGYQVGLCGYASVYDKDKVDIYFTSPESNVVYIKLKLIDGSGKTIGETGVLKPGEYVKSITLSEVPAQTENITYKVMGYEPDTWNNAGAATMNTTLNVG